MSRDLSRSLVFAVLIAFGCGCGEGESEDEPPHKDAGNVMDGSEVDAPDGGLSADLVLGCDGPEVVYPSEEILAAYEMCSESDLLLDPCGNKINSLILGKNGKQGEGLDIDEDPTTCSPIDNCSDGIDNQLSSLAAVAQPGIDEAIIQGTLNLLLEYEELSDGDENFVIKMYAGVIASSNEDCDWYTEPCSYDIRYDSFDIACEPLVVFDDAKLLENGQVSAGGPGTDLTLTIPLFGLIVALPVQGAKLLAQVETTENGLIYRMHGLIGGAVSKATLVETLDEIPGVEYQAVGLVKSFILAAVDLALVDDLDTDGDGVADATSLAANFDTLPANLEGYLLPKQ